MGKCSTGELKATLGDMMTRLDQIAEKETRHKAENEEFEEVRTSLETLEKKLARILKEILGKLGGDGLEHGKTRRGKKKD